MAMSPVVMPEHCTVCASSQAVDLYETSANTSEALSEINAVDLPEFQTFA
ncbi:MAG: hypothetical protein O9337_13775 [Acidovorax sp.]|nr:hypothetical protein [Acidovorax sp.]MCZ8220481.1 hypothetical protein [Acidovorax sp.]